MTESIGARLKRMALQEEREVEREEEHKELHSSQAYPFGGKEGYIAWLKATNRWFEVRV